VHRARLLNGEEVAVKVQYAGLESAVAADLATFAGLATIAGLAFPDFKLGWVRILQAAAYIQAAVQGRSYDAAYWYTATRQPQQKRWRNVAGNQKGVKYDWHRVSS